METIALNSSDQLLLNKKFKKLKDNIKENGVQDKKWNKQRKNNQRGVVYIGHIPHGFYEDEMRSYFSQFGKVTRVKLARSAKTGVSKGYGFVEFQHCEVARIVAETMNNYLMFNRLLKTRYIPPSEQGRNMFNNIYTADDFPRKKFREKTRTEKNAILSKEKEQEKINKYEKKVEDFKKFLEERGIEFNFRVNNPNENNTTKAEKETINNAASESSSVDTFDDRAALLNDVENDPYAVLEIDESDDEIQFNIPQDVKKVLKRSSTSALIPPKAKKLKNKSTTVSNIQSGKKLIKSLSSSTFPKIKGKLKEWTKAQGAAKGKKSPKEVVASRGVGKKFVEKIKKEKASLGDVLKPKKQKKIKLNKLKKGVENFLLNGNSNRNSLLLPNINLKKKEKSPELKSFKKLNGSINKNFEETKKISTKKKIAEKSKKLLKNKTQKSKEDKKKLLKKDKLNQAKNYVVSKKLGIKKSKIAKDKNRNLMITKKVKKSKLATS